MTTAQLSPDRPDLRDRVVAVAEDLHWLHTSLGLIGNVCFFVGSVFFLFESLKTAGVWLFIVGSLGMLLGSIGDKAMQVERMSEPGVERMSEPSTQDDDGS